MLCMSTGRGQSPTTILLFCEGADPEPFLLRIVYIQLKEEFVYGGHVLVHVTTVIYNQSGHITELSYTSCIAASFTEGDHLLCITLADRMSRLFTQGVGVTVYKPSEKLITLNT